MMPYEVDEQVDTMRTPQHAPSHEKQVEAANECGQNQ
jgi:hypothetical protein